MKKLLAFLLVATMIVAMFAIPAAADEKVNYEEEFKFVEKAPNIDGKVQEGEYGTIPVHSYPDAKDQFDDKTNFEFGEDEVEFDFYAAWDADNLYMAWVVKSDIHTGMPEQDFNGDGSWNPDGDSNYMWQYSCLQFILVPGAPAYGETNYQTSEWSGNYLEVGLALTAEGTSVRAWWSKPTNAPALDVNEWDANIVRDGAKKTTTYEVKIPWSKSGVDEIGNKAQFGLTYAVAAQNDYTVKKGMIEWQDAILSGKAADKAAVVTLTGNEEIEKEQNSHDGGNNTTGKTEGTVPAEAANAVQIIIDGVDVSITGEKAYLYTNPSTINENNNAWAACLLLKPVEGEDGVYEIVETKVGAGEKFNFDSEIEEGMIAFGAHSDGSGAGNDRRNAVMALGVGDKLALFGINEDMTDTLYTNSMFYVVSGNEGGDTSTDESTEESVEESTEESVEESTEASVEESVEASTEASTEASGNTTTTEEEGSLLWLWIVIGVVVVAGVVVAVVVISKKK